MTSAAHLESFREAEHFNQNPEGWDLSLRKLLHSEGDGSMKEVPPG